MHTLVCYAESDTIHLLVLRSDVFDAAVLPLLDEYHESRYKSKVAEELCRVIRGNAARTVSAQTWAIDSTDLFTYNITQVINIPELGC